LNRNTVRLHAAGQPRARWSRTTAEALDMDPIWILLAVVAWALGLVFVLVLLSGLRASNRERQRRDPFSDVTVARLKEPPDARR
jgi:hypothetical protein